MDTRKDRPSWEFSWRFIVIYAILMLVVIILVVVTLLTDLFYTSEEGQIPPVVWLLVAAVLMIAIITILSKILKILDVLHNNGVKLERLIDALEKNRSALAQVNQSARLSEAAKAIVFRDGDRQFLRQAVLDKLQQRDFDSAYEIIDEIAHRAGYKELAEHLRAEADRCRGATDQERMDGALTDIERLFESYQWAKANAAIERLIGLYPDSEEAKAIRQRLLDKKGERKKVLLNAWDDAVKRRATDRSLEILKELDLYLTPEEGFALQEAARDVFKDKLHNLGVQFSLAVSGEQWDKAVEIGRQIIRDFPNSRMSAEIRERMDVLKQRVR